MIDIELSDDILSQIGSAVEDPDSRSIKFDDAGTLHIMSRHKDGTLLEDVAMREEGITRTKNEREEENSLKEDISRVGARVKKTKVKFYEVLFAIMLLVIAAVSVVIIMR